MRALQKRLRLHGAAPCQIYRLCISMRRLSSHLASSGQSSFCRWRCLAGLRSKCVVESLRGHARLIRADCVRPHRDWRSPSSSGPPSSALLTVLAIPAIHAVMRDDGRPWRKAHTQRSPMHSRTRRNRRRSCEAKLLISRCAFSAPAPHRPTRRLARLCSNAPAALAPVQPTP